MNETPNPIATAVCEAISQEYIASRLYRAYFANLDGQTPDGHPLPRWEGLLPDAMEANNREAWRAVANEASKIYANAGNPKTT